MRVLLTAPPLPDLTDPHPSGPIRVCPNLGLYLLAAIAQARGHDVGVIDPVHFDREFGDPAATARAVRDFDLVGVSINSCSWPRAKALLQELDRIEPRPRIVLGGPHASALPEHLAATSPADYVVSGEADRTFPELLDRLARGEDAAGAPGTVAVRGGKIVAGPPAPLLSPEELAALPLPRLDLIPDGYYDLLPLETSRGCKHACVFCSGHLRKNWRGLDPDAVARRLEHATDLIGRVTRHAVFIVDDCMTADHDRLERLAGRLEAASHPFVFEARIADLVAGRVLDAVARLPIMVMEMGVECGYAKGLARAGKGLALDQVELAARLIDERGLSSRARYSFIMGLPWETRVEVMKTLEYAFKLAGRRGARLVASWLTVFPASPVYRRRREWGIELEAEDFDRDRWWSDVALFRRTHPQIDPDRDFADIGLYIQMLIRLFPQIRHDGWFRHIME